MTISQLSRRDFLKLSASGVLGLALSELGIDRALAAPPTSQGRITWSGIPLYDEPHPNANKLFLFPIDETVELLGEVEGEGIDNPFNKTWYKLDGGYTYSGWVQPVETKYQKPFFEIPTEGKLAEIRRADELDLYRSIYAGQERTSPVLRHHALDHKSGCHSRREKHLVCDI